MTVKKPSLVLGFAALLAASAAFAGISVPPAPTVTTTGVAGSATDSVSRGYVGLKWTLGEGLTPAVVIGYRQARVKSSGDTQGADISFSFNVAGGLRPDKLRAKYFSGRENLQGELGAGYDFTKGIFAGVSAQAPYTNAGVDYLFMASAPWQLYVMLNTLKKYDKPQGDTTTTTLSCPAPFVLAGTACIVAPTTTE
jgi:hypothetical protein